MNEFAFIHKGERLAADGLVAVLPADIQTKEQLFDLLAVALSFPDYFGRNWDALTDMLADFCWVSEYKITIRHVELPRLTDDELVIYIYTLIDAVHLWRKYSNEHLLDIVFSIDDKRRIEEILAMRTEAGLSQPVVKN